MRGAAFTAPVDGGHLGGWVDGSGPPVLMVHGGPGLSYEYLDEMADDIGSGYRIASYQQRGLAPSMLDGPFDIDTHVADVVAVLDHLGWPAATVVGHSWGGHLALHLAARIPQRLDAVLCVDLLGGVADGGAEKFGQELVARTPESQRARVVELDAKSDAGQTTSAEDLEGLEILWPAYFADPSQAPPFPNPALSVEASHGGFAAIAASLPGLEASLPSIRVPLGIVMGAKSPMPLDEAAEQTAARIPGAWVSVVEGAGHFMWFERPGCVRAALQRLVAS